MQILRKKNGESVIVSDAEIIQNALDQESAGIKPHYCFWDYKNSEAVTPPGWLVWSSYDDGCIVVYRRDDGKMVISKGWQGDFAYI